MASRIEPPHPQISVSELYPSWQGLHGQYLFVEGEHRMLLSPNVIQVFMNDYCKKGQFLSDVKSDGVVPQF